VEKDWIQIKFASQLLSSISRLLARLAGLFAAAATRFYKSEQQRRIIPWFRDNGDATLRLDYDLDQDSVVFDLGGYEGKWTSEISNRYNCSVYVFEPVKRFAAQISNRFAKNTRVKVLQFGLGDETHAVEIGLDKDGSSTFRKSPSMEEIRLVRACEFINSNGISKIDLMKINIEGGEYDLLEHLLDCGMTDRIVNIQVQFHDFVPRAAERMSKIQQRLQNTHFLTYQYPFVWENWRLSADPTNGSEVR